MKKNLVIGVLKLNTRFPRLVGDAGNPKTYPCKVIVKRLRHTTVKRVLGGRLPGPAAEEVLLKADSLQSQGPCGITTTCGLLLTLQDQLASKLETPILTSPLLQLDLLLKVYPKNKKICIVTAHTDTLYQILPLAQRSKRIVVVGMEQKPEFKKAILDDNQSLDKERLRAELLDAAKQALRQHPDIGCFLLECTNLPPYADSLREEVGLPVYDFTTMIEWFYSGYRTKAYSQASKKGLPINHTAKRIRKV